MKIKACPKTCKFDWKQFHRQLDIAFAHMIEESSEGYPSMPILPSTTTIMDLLEYSFKKRELQTISEDK